MPYPPINIYYVVIFCLVGAVETTAPPGGVRGYGKMPYPPIGYKITQTYAIFIRNVTF